MPQSLKFVFLGTTAVEVEEFLSSLSQSLGGSEVTHGEVAGSLIYRFSYKGKMGDEQKRELFIFGASTDSDFRGLSALFLKNADGLIGLIPAGAARVSESRMVLAALHRASQARRAEAEELPFLIQYHWPLQSTDPSPEDLDRLLGVNPEVVERVLSRAGDDDVKNGVFALFKRL